MSPKDIRAAASATTPGSRLLQNLHKVGLHTWSEPILTRAPRSETPMTLVVPPTMRRPAMLRPQYAAARTRRSA